ncbi:MAG TPA: MMPL family transporter, partial [Desulfuromonadales bacterium]|nr:MMPL family transporter [Desulfuromonadales bacterium]
MASTRPQRALAIFSCALLLAAVAILTIRFETDIFRLFPTSQPALKLLLESIEWTGGAKEAYFLLEGNREALPQEARRFEERLRLARIDGRPAFTRITWRLFDEQQAAAFNDLVSYAVIRPDIFLKKDDVEKYALRFTAPQITTSLERLQSELAGPFGGQLSRLATSDPLHLRDLILPRLKGGSQALDLDPASPYFASRNGRMLIMIAEPARPVQEMEFSRRLVTVINDARKGSGVAISCAGAHISAVMDEAALKSNVLISVVSSLLVVLGIFYAAYRRLLPTLLIPLILACGVVLALGAAGLFVRSIHIISFAFTALITGIGTDYSIHLYDRFHTERAAGNDTETALRLAFLNTGHGIFTAAVTTALPFLALCISDVRALSELGLLVGLGVIFSLYTSLLFLPPLLTYMDRRFPIDYRPIPALGMRGVWRISQWRPGLITAASLLLTAGLWYAAGRVQFDGDLKNLQPRHSEAFLAQEKIERNLSIAPRHLLVAVEGREMDSVMTRMSAVDRLAAGLQQRGEIIAWSSLAGIINTPTDQNEVARRLKPLLAGTSADQLARQLERQGFASQEFRPFLDKIESITYGGVAGMAEVLDRLAASPLKGVVDRHLARDRNGYHALIYLHYRGDEFKQDSFLAELRTIDPTARVTGMDMVASQLGDTVRTSFIKAFLLGGSLVLLLLLVHFVELPSGVFYSLFPVAAATGCMLGILALCGMKLNYMNVMVLVTIMGMGSDFGLYIRFRVTALTAQEREQQYVQTARAAFLSALTTIAGFGSLALTDYGAMS